MWINPPAPYGEPLGAPASQQGNTTNLVQKLKEGEGDGYFNLSLTPNTHSHVHQKVVRVTVRGTENKGHPQASPNDSPGIPPH